MIIRGNGHHPSNWLFTILDDDGPGGPGQGNEERKILSTGRL